MPKVLFKIILLLFTIQLLGQEIDIIEQNKKFIIPKEKRFGSTYNNFENIENNFKLNDFLKVGIVKAHYLKNGNKTLVALYYKLWNTANEMGANSYTIDSVIKKIDTITVCLSFYQFNEHDFTKNNELKNKNIIYIIGDYNQFPVKRNLSINNQKLVLLPNKYLLYKTKIGDNLKINIGGVLGETKFIKVENEIETKYFSLVGFDADFDINNSVSVKFSTGRITKLESDFGNFLITIFEKQE
jgi:hypothetical protein